VLRLLVTDNVVPTSPILVSLIGGDTFLRNFSSYKSHTATIPEDGILHSDRREILKSYTLYSCRYNLAIFFGITEGFDFIRCP
jgi:hypothetical protein